MKLDLVELSNLLKRRDKPERYIYLCTNYTNETPI